MASYKLCILGKDGHIRRSHDVDCTDDEQALEWALDFEWPEGIEVWEGTRKVGLVKPEAPGNQFFAPVWALPVSRALAVP